MGWFRNGRSTRALIPKLALVFGVSFAALGTGTTALALTDSVSLPGSAKMLAGGAALALTVTYSCATTNYAYISVQVNERVGKGLTGGYGNSGRIESTCNGTTKTTSVTVFADVDRGPFASGKAVAQASLYTNNGQALTTKVIKLKQ